MGFHVDYDSLNQKFSLITNNVQSWTASLESINDSVNRLIESSNISGKGSDSIKLYLDSIHNTIIPCINELLVAHMGNYLVYSQDYHANIDTGLESVIDESELNSIKQRLTPNESSGGYINSQVQSTLSSVSDLIYVSCSGYDSVEDYHKDINDHITQLVEDINSLEEKHVSNDFVDTSSVLNELTAFINERLADTRDYKTSFTVESLSGNESVVNLFNSAIALDKNLESKQDEFADAMKSQEEYLKALNEELERRERNAKAAKIGLTIVVVIGAAAVGALTGGLGAAVIVGAASGAVMAGGSTAIDQYAEHGWNTDKWDYGAIGKSALFGGIAGGITGAIGYGSTEVFKGLGSKYLSSALTSSSLPVRVGTNAVLGTTKEITSGVAGRFTSTLVVETLKTGDIGEAVITASEKGFDGKSILIDGGIGALTGGYQGLKKPVSVKKQYNDADIIDDGPYIRNGKQHGRPQLSGKAKLEFEEKVYQACVGDDGILRDPHTGVEIDWKPGDARSGVVDFGHKSGLEYDDIFQEYAHGKITLDELKDFQFNADNFVLEAPSTNRSHNFEVKGATEIKIPTLSKKEEFLTDLFSDAVSEEAQVIMDENGAKKYSININLDRSRFGTPTLFGGMA